MSEIANHVTAQLLSHRSIRRYQDKSIPEEVLRTIIRCGQGAPSSSFVQAYSIVRVSNPSVREQIAKAAGGQVWIEQAPEFWVICADLKRIAYCGDKQQQAPLAGFTEYFLVASVDAALMAQNMFVAAESFGLGGVFIGGIRNDPALVSELLALPDQVYPVFGFCLGWPDQSPDLKPRLPVEAIFHQDRYDQERIAADVDYYDQQMQDYYQSRANQQRTSTWSEQTVKAVHKKQRAHMRHYLQARGFLTQ